METKKKKILVVDDEQDVVKYLQTLLNDNGFDVVTASNGKECLAKAREEKPDLITLDISMPYESGLRTYRDLQADEATKNIPVFIITGVSGELHKFNSARNISTVPLEYFEKPIDREKLIKSIKKLV